MQKIAVMTDSNCGILPDEGKKLGISIVPMPVIIDGTTYYEGVDITAEEFYKRQAAGAEITSSLPSPGDVMDMWEALLKEHDEVVYIPMTSGLSTSCHSAVMLTEEYDGRVHVVDNKRISVTQMQSVFDACKMAEQGMTGSQIKQRLEEEALDATIYIAVDTLEYLKKGGRITPAVAAIGSVLNIKPVMWIGGDKLDAHAKARGMKGAFRKMCKALHEDLDGRLKDLHDLSLIHIFGKFGAHSEQRRNPHPEDRAGTADRDRSCDSCDVAGSDGGCKRGADSLKRRQRSV